MSDRKSIKKLNELITVSINLVEIDHNSSLIITRKALEYLVQRVYDYEGIQKPVDEKGYYVLSNLIDVLKEKIVVASHIIELMHKVRRNGNDAVHFNIKNPTKSSALISIKLLCEIVVWYLKRYQIYENSLCLLAGRRSRSKMSPNEFGQTYYLNESLVKIFKMSIFKNTKALISSLDTIKYNIIIDPELKEYVEWLNELVRRYYDAFENYDPSENLLEIAKRKFLGNKKMTPREIFITDYGRYLDHLDSLKQIISKLYLLSQR